MKYEIKLYKIAIVILIIAFIFLSVVSMLASKDRETDFNMTDNELYNQVQYTIFLQDIMDNHNVEYDYYYDFLVNYLYPNGELNQQLHTDYIELGY